jgi:oxalate decarboxylase
VLAKNFGVSEAALASIPADVAHTRYIFPGQVPGPIESDIVRSGAGIVPQTFSYRLMAQEPIRAQGGWGAYCRFHQLPSSDDHRRSVSEYRAGRNARAALAPPRRMAVLHLRTRRMTVFASAGSARTFNFQSGDVGYVPFAMAPLRYLEMFRSPRFVRPVAQPTDGTHTTRTGASPLEL